MNYKTLSSACYLLNCHFVWIPKYRKPILTETIKKHLNVILRTICAAQNWEILELQIQPDHIHLFLSVPPYDSPTAIVKVLKGTSARLLFVAAPDLKLQLRRGHVWSPGYYVGSAGNVSTAMIQEYIKNQSRNSSTH
jgi:putative transposase